jgi:hypothetical protein
MPNYYYDAAQTGNGHAGTDVDAWSGEDLVNSSNPATTGDTIFLRGMGSITLPACASFPAFTTGVIFDKWGSDPWRLRINRDGDSYNSWDIIPRNGIISFYNASGAVGPAIGRSGQRGYNAIYINEDSPESSFAIHSNAAHTELDGVILIGSATGKLYFFCATVDPIVLKDSVFDIGGGIFQYIPGSAPGETVNNCAFRFSDPSDANFVNTNCQFGWTTPSWPAWNAAKEDWAAAILASGINTPPQPGNSPYTGYETDPWGNSRTGIGAFYTPSSGSTSPSSSESPSASESASESPSSSESASESPSSSESASVSPSSSASASASPSSSASSSVSPSASASPTVDPSPYINVQPADTGFELGSVARLRVTAHVDVGTLSYQWYKGSSPVGTNSSVLIVSSSFADADRGTYHVDVTANAITVTSDDAVVTTKPKVEEQSRSHEMEYGGRLELHVSASGKSPVTFQWYKDGNIMPGKTDSTLVIDPFVGDPTFVCAITSDGNTVLSDPMVITIETAPTGLQEVQVLTPLKLLERVTRQINENFFEWPGRWAVVNTDGSLSNQIPGVNAAISKLVIGCRPFNKYEGHDSSVGRVTTLEGHGFRVKVNSVGFSGSVNLGDRLVVSSAEASDGKLVSLELTAPSGTYEVVARVEELGPNSEWIVYKTLSPYIVIKP